MRGGALVRRGLPAAVAAGAVVLLLANVRAKPQVKALPFRTIPPPPLSRSQAPTVRRVRSRPATAKGPIHSATGQSIFTPFSTVSVRVMLKGDQLIRVETVDLSGAGARAQAINARAEPILREEALKAGTAKIDIVTGATYTSQSYIDSLQSAIDRARHG